MAVPPGQTNIRGCFEGVKKLPKTQKRRDALVGNQYLREHFSGIFDSFTPSSRRPEGLGLVYPFGETGTGTVPEPAGGTPAPRETGKSRLNRLPLIATGSRHNVVRIFTADDQTHGQQQGREVGG